MTTIREAAIAERTQLIQEYNPVTGNFLSDGKDILLRFLQEFFYQSPTGKNLFHFEPAEEWQTEEEMSEVIITDHATSDTATNEKRPVILISRTQFAAQGLGLDNFVKEDMTTGEVTHSELWSGGFSITCCAREGLEAEKMALLVARAIKTYQKILHQAGFYNISNRIAIGPENPANNLFPGSSIEDFVYCVVSFPCQWQDVWTVKPIDVEILNGIKLTVRSIARKFDGSLLYPDSINPDGSPNPDSKGVVIKSWTIN